MALVLGVPSIMLVLGLIIILGFFSTLFFERTKIPDIIILMLVGLLIGPVFKLVQPGDFLPFAPFIGALALIIVLMDGGLNLDIFKVLTELSRSTGFTFLVFALTIGLGTAFLHYILAWPLLHALLMATVVGGTSSAIVIPILSQVSPNENIRIFLSLESVLTDVLCIVFGLAFLQIILSNQFNVGAASHSLVSAFSIAAVVGVLFAVLWIGVIHRFYGKPFSYFVTLAVVFILYAAVESVQGSGAIAVLTFALLLANSKRIAALLKIEGQYALDRSIKTVQNEISFFVKTFFFVYLGLIFQLDSALETPVLLASIGLLATIALARAIVVEILSRLDSSIAQFKTLFISMMPRGLAAAVLAFLPMQAGLQINYFPEIAFFVLFLTNVVATIGVFKFASEDRSGPEPEQSQPPRQQYSPRIRPDLTKPRIVKK
ncbi:MAG: cation:proton antiporter [Candidatus Micrarchaeota archaeon]